MSWLFYNLVLYLIIIGLFKMQKKGIGIVYHFSEM